MRGVSKPRGADADGTVIERGKARNEAVRVFQLGVVVDDAVIALGERAVCHTVGDIKLLRVIGAELICVSAVLLRAFFRNGRRVQGKNILHKRIVLRGIQAARLVMRQPGSLHRAALRQIPRVAEQVKLRRAEGEQQRKTADAKPQPARPEHVDRLLQKHFPTK